MRNVKLLCYDSHISLDFRSNGIQQNNARATFVKTGVGPVILSVDVVKRLSCIGNVSTGNVILEQVTVIQSKEYLLVVKEMSVRSNVALLHPFHTNVFL
jgi:hypothetical protein